MTVAVTGGRGLAAGWLAQQEPGFGVGYVPQGQADRTARVLVERALDERCRADDGHNVSLGRVGVSNRRNQQRARARASLLDEPDWSGCGNGTGLAGSVQGRASAGFGGDIEPLRWLVTGKRGDEPDNDVLVPWSGGYQVTVFVTLGDLRLPGLFGVRDARIPRQGLQLGRAFDDGAGNVLKAVLSAG